MVPPWVPDPLLPNLLAHDRIGELPLFDQLLPQTPYVGEIGLDGAPEFREYWNDQLTAFEHVLNACQSVGGRIMSIHSRRASQEVIKRLEDHPEAGTPILHWFSGSFRDLDRAVGIGCWFSVGPSMLRSEKGRALTARMPRKQVITESDGPFAHINGHSLWPWQASEAVDQLSDIWGTNRECVEKILQQNLEELLKEEVA